MIFNEGGGGYIGISAYLSICLWTSFCTRACIVWKFVVHSVFTTWYFHGDRTIVLHFKGIFWYGLYHSFMKNLILGSPAHAYHFDASNEAKRKCYCPFLLTDSSLNKLFYASLLSLNPFYVLILQPFLLSSEADMWLFPWISLQVAEWCAQLIVNSNFKQNVFSWNSCNDIRHGWYLLRQFTDLIKWVNPLARASRKVMCI